MDSTFAQDVLAGLAANPKRISSKYFYDERGNRLFQAIMQLDEYYLTRSEYEVLAMNKAALLAIFQPKVTAYEGASEQGMVEEDFFELIEFGAGDGLKIKLLLEYFLEQQAHFKYIPIDISADAVNGLVADLRTIFPELEIEGLQDDYFKALDYLKNRSKVRKIAVFLGANIGNFSEAEAIQFLSSLRKSLNPDDLLMIGFDLKKDPQQILAAYNDASGVTRDFNLNLLQRMNDELGADFNLSQFKHYPTYDPISGEARSFLMSTCDQKVHFSRLNWAAPRASFQFNAWEPIHLEISKKYDLPTINRLAAQAGYEVVQHFFDNKHFFVDTVWKVK